MASKKETEKRMLSFEELAEYIGLAVQTVRNKYYAREFPIPGKKIFGRVLFDRKDVDQYLDGLQPINC